MPEDKDRDKKMETLSKAIVEAIVKSKDVRKAIGKISNQEDLFSGSLMVLMLKLQNLVDSVDIDNNAGLGGTARRGATVNDEIDGRAERKPTDLDIYEEGQKLSPNEAAFRKFLSEKFDQEKWLKRHGLNL